jgi:2-isopropylmalate synthase
MNGAVTIYDTTLRDGAQAEGVSFSVEDKLQVAQRLDDIGIHYIEGGWPGSNAKDVEFFRRIRAVPLKQARVAAFGSTRRAGMSCEADNQVALLLAAETPVVTIVGKSWDLHVHHVLETTLDENLCMIQETVAYLKAYGRQVFYDAEHFFDGYKANPEYALSCVAVAQVGDRGDRPGDGRVPGWGDGRGRDRHPHARRRGHGRGKCDGSGARGRDPGAGHA